MHLNYQKDKDTENLGLVGPIDNDIIHTWFLSQAQLSVGLNSGPFELDLYTVY